MGAGDAGARQLVFISYFSVLSKQSSLAEAGVGCGVANAACCIGVALCLELISG
jgi:hypothetical protein